MFFADKRRLLLTPLLHRRSTTTNSSHIRPPNPIMSEPIIATPAFLDRLRSQYPSNSTSPSTSNPWYIIAAVGFSACNRPEEVPRVCLHALKGVENMEDQKVVVERIRDALFKSGINAGYSKVINALIEMKNTLPEELKETSMHRDSTLSIKDLETQGAEFFTKTYGQTATSVQSLLDSVYADLGFFSRALAYGYVYSFPKFLTAVETSYVLVATLIASDTPRQIKWHLDGARRNGATDEEAQAVRQMAIDVVTVSGTRVRNEVPPV